MRDLFLQSDSVDNLLVDLEKTYPSFVSTQIISGVEKKWFVPSGLINGDSFAIDFCGILAIPGSAKLDLDENLVENWHYYDGFHCNIRLFGSLENAFDSFSSEHTKIINPKTPCRVFA